MNDTQDCERGIFKGIYDDVFGDGEAPGGGAELTLAAATEKRMTG